MLEEEMIDLLTFYLQNPDSGEVSEKKNRVAEIGRELFIDGGIDAMENMYFVLENRIKDEIGKDPKPCRSWWNGISSDWNY